MPHDGIIESIKNTYQRVIDLGAMEVDARDELQALVTEAVGRGVTISSIAKAMRVTRQSVYNLLKRGVQK